MRRSVLLVGLAIFMATIDSADCIAQGLKTGITRHEDIHAAGISLASTGVLWQADISVPGAAFLRIFFKNIRSDKAGHYHIRIVNGIGGTLLEVTKEEFEKFGAFVTGEIPGSFSQVQIVGDMPSPKSEISFDISETGFDALQPSLLSTPSSGSDLQSVNSFSSGDPIRRVAEAVARLSISRLDQDGLQKLYTCTGFMVTKDIVVTNYHCIRTPEDCITTVAYFLRTDSHGELNKKLERRCEELIEAIYGLDIALFRVRRPSATDPANSGAGPLLISDREPTSGEQLVILGHPNGNALEISKKNCSLTTLTAPGMWALSKTDFGHGCTTSEGSSGSPVIDADYKVVGLHHLGFDGSGRWATENRAVKATRFSKLIETVINSDKSN
jgi:hypothetical protein